MQHLDISKAADLIRAGKLVAVPTETVYGLAADATNSEAVSEIFAVKSRPLFNPLICHVADIRAAQDIGLFNSDSLKLAEAFWPGPLTLVLPLRAGSGLSDLVTAGLDTVAIRVPAHPIAQALLRDVGRPLAAPSANRSGRVSPTTAAHVSADLGEDVALVLDGDAAAVGIESTIVDCSGRSATLLRHGAVTREMLERELAHPVMVGEEAPQEVRAPGQLKSHYAPRALVRLHAKRAERGEALLAFGPNIPAHDGPVLNLSASGDLAEAARNLFSSLRALDREDIHTIAVMPVPNEGLGKAINDRLARAAAPRQG